MTGIVKGFEIKKNRDSNQDVLMLQVEIDKDNVQSIQYMSSVGDNSIPVEGSIVTILTQGNAWKIAVAYNDLRDFNSSLKEGDKHLYSKDNASFVKILSNGDLNLNGDSRDAARKDDTIKSTITENPIFWAWIAAAGVILAGLGLVAPTPTTLDGKITSGNDKVKMS